MPSSAMIKPNVIIGVPKISCCIAGDITTHSAATVVSMSPPHIHA